MICWMIVDPARCHQRFLHAFTVARRGLHVPRAPDSFRAKPLDGKAIPILGAGKVSKRRIGHSREELPGTTLHKN
jgi:hypothetical protein